MLHGFQAAQVTLVGQPQINFTISDYFFVNFYFNCGGKEKAALKSKSLVAFEYY